MDDDFKACEFTFRKDVVDKLINFVLDCHQNIIELTNCRDEEILISIPNYLLDFVKKEHIKHVNTFPLGDVYLCGMKCQFSFDNSITVFYNAYIPTQIIKYTQQL